jgi:hypothetical protein
MSGRQQRTYRRVVTSFWTDPDLRRRKLSREQKYLLLYFFTNHHTNLAGLYWLPLTYATQEAELNLEDVEQWVRSELSPYVTYDFETEEILVHRLAWHNVGEDLKKRDNRVKAIERALGDAHSQMLVEKFLAVYSAWPIRLKNVAQPRHDEGATPSPLPKPLTKDLTKVLGEAQPSPVPAQPLASPVPLPDRSIKPPAPSGNSEALRFDGQRREVESTEGQRPRHPDLERLWDGGLRDVVRDVWHQGVETVQLDETAVGIGLEYWLLNDLLHQAGDPDLVSWIVTVAPSTLGWADRPRTLHWLHRAENFAAATSEYFRSAPAIRVPKVTLQTPVPPDEAERIERRKQELRAQAAQLRAGGV